jgi:hypothetical protein
LQNTIFIYPEILNKTSLALMFTSDILSIFFSLIIKSSICCILFVSLSDRIFILFFAHNLARIFIPKKKLNFQISLRIKWSPHNRYIGGSRGGQVPHFVLCYRLVKTYFNRIFPNYWNNYGDDIHILVWDIHRKVVEWNRLPNPKAKKW